MHRLEIETLALIKSAFGEEKTYIAGKDDMEKIYTICKQHSIANILFYALREDGEAEDEIKSKLEGDHRRAIQREVQQDVEVRGLCEALAQNGIRYMPLKGIVIKNIYPSSDMRSMADADILIDEDKIEAAAEIAKSLGYKTGRLSNNHDSYYKKPYVSVEFHRALIGKASEMGLHEYFGSWKRARLKTGTTYEWELSDEDFYIFMIGHTAKHFYSGGIGIRAILDIYLYLESKGSRLNREYIDNEFDKCGLRIFATQIEQLIKIWFKGEATNKFFDRLTHFLFMSEAYGIFEHSAAHDIIIQKEAQSFKATKAKKTLRVIFPNMQSMSLSVPWVKGKPLLLPAAWIFRIIRTVLCHRHNIPLLNKTAGIKEEKVLKQMELYEQMGLKIR